MYSIHFSKKFTKQFKKIARSGVYNIEYIYDVIDLLASGERLPAKFFDHRLKGNFVNFRECHIYPDLLLIYFIAEKTLMMEMIQIGSHSELFG